MMAQVQYTQAERKLLKRLSSPVKIQDYLDTLKREDSESYMSPRRVIRAKSAHCMEGALFAAAALEFHGQPPLLMDLRADDPDVDHVVTLFKQFGHWGCISKTNHAVLRYREPVYNLRLANQIEIEAGKLLEWK
jgi:hypothetical protein